MNNHYLIKIAAITKANPRHVLAYMRLENGCLDDLSAEAFEAEVTICAECAIMDPAAGEKLAKSFAL